MSILHTLAPCLGDAAALEPCLECDGHGRHEPHASGRCDACDGSGDMVELECGSCGALEQELGGALLHDERICLCGHTAPHYMWLPQRREVSVTLWSPDRKETA